MSRVAADTFAEVSIARPPADVWEMVSNVPVLLGLLPWLDHVEALDDADARYLFHLGPFGIGGFRGTLRCDVDVVREGHRMTLTSRPDSGNTDCRVEIEVREGRAGHSRASASLYASPRKELPALLSLGFVQRVAQRTAQAGLERGMMQAKAELEDAP